MLLTPGTGQLRTTKPLNYEAMSTHQTPSYMLTYYYLYIGVSDGSADDYISVEVKVEDVEEDGSRGPPLGPAPSRHTNCSQCE